MLENEYEGLNARPKVYLSKEYFCKMYPTCVSSKLCKFIFFLTHALVPCGPFVVIYVPKVHGDIPPSLMVLFCLYLGVFLIFYPTEYCAKYKMHLINLNLLHRSAS